MAICPICFSEEFVSQSKRPNARCAKCGSLERGRFFFKVAEKLGIFSGEGRLCNIAPERWLYKFCKQYTRLNYVPLDIDPVRYQKTMPETQFVDISEGFSPALVGSFDYIVHNHVMEHVRAPLPVVLTNLLAGLKPGGKMFFSMPVRVNVCYDEDLSPDLSEADASARFGQGNHVRIFGDIDIVKTLTSAAPSGRFEFNTGTLFRPDELGAYAVPERARTAITSHTSIVVERAT